MIWINLLLNCPTSSLTYHRLTMKSRYILIVSEELTAATPIYEIWGGRQRSDVAGLTKLLLLSELHPTLVYFQKYSADVCEYLCRINHSFGGSLVDPKGKLNIIQSDPRAALEIANQLLSGLTSKPKAYKYAI